MIAMAAALRVFRRICSCILDGIACCVELRGAHYAYDALHATIRSQFAAACKPISSAVGPLKPFCGANGESVEFRKPFHLLDTLLEGCNSP